MRNLVEEDCNSGDYAQITAHQKRCSNGQSICEVMSEVSGKVQVASHLNFLTMIMWNCKIKIPELTCSSQRELGILVVPYIFVMVLITPVAETRHLSLVIASFQGTGEYAQKWLFRLSFDIFDKLDLTNDQPEIRPCQRKQRKINLNASLFFSLANLPPYTKTKSINVAMSHSLKKCVTNRLRGKGFGHLLQFQKKNIKLTLHFMRGKSSAGSTQCKFKFCISFVSFVSILMKSVFSFGCFHDCNLVVKFDGWILVIYIMQNTFMPSIMHSSAYVQNVILE